MTDFPITFFNKEHLKEFAAEVDAQTPCWHARWTIEIPLPLPIARIRHATACVLGKNKAETETERLHCTHLLLDWAQNHPPHPDVPEYANRSYLPDDLASVRFTREVHPCWEHKAITER